MQDLCGAFLTGWQTLAKFDKKSNNKQVLTPMASGSGSGSGKRPEYVDLDALNLSGKDSWDPRSVPAASHRSSGSSGSKKPKKAQNPNRPGKKYVDAAQEIVLHYYKVRSMEML